jgi:hypothetical protein
MRGYYLYLIGASASAVRRALCDHVVRFCGGAAVELAWHLSLWLCEAVWCYLRACWWWNSGYVVLCCWSEGRRGYRFIAVWGFFLNIYYI